MKNLRRFKKAGYFLAVLVLTAMGHVTEIQAADSFFKGKTMSLIIPASPGGGMDYYGRTIGRYFAKKYDLNFIAVNTPGSGGIIATNKLARAKPNGLTMASVNMPGLMFTQMLGETAIKFTLDEFNYIGRPEEEPAVLFVGKNTGIKSVEDIANGKREFTAGFTGLASDDWYFAKLQTDLINAKMRPIPAFDGASEINLAVIKGDIDAGQNSWSTMRSLIEAGEVIPILQLGKKRIVGLENVPTVREVVPADKKGLVDNILDLKELGARTWAAPKGVPADRVKELRDTFWEVMHHPDFVKEMEKAKKMIVPLRGEEIQKMANNVLGSAELKSLVQQFKK